MKSQDEIKKTKGASKDASVGKSKKGKKAVAAFNEIEAAQVLEAQLEGQSESASANAIDAGEVATLGAGPSARSELSATDSLETDSIETMMGAGAVTEGKVIDLESGLSADEIQEAMQAEFGQGADMTPATGASDGVVIEPLNENTDSFEDAVEAGGSTVNENEGDPLAVLGSQQELGLNSEALAELSATGPTGEVAFIEEMLPNELSHVQAKSIIESILFASHHPVSFASLKAVFNGTNISAETLWDILNLLQTDYAGGERGINLEEVAGGYQLRTKLDNAGWLKKLVKARPFRLSGPALEVLSIIAYKQPVIKSEIDDIRGVESGHLVRALMEKHLVRFSGKSELPGKPMLYATTKNFLELFGLRNIRELPTLSEIDKLIPEGIGEGTDLGEKETLSSLSDKIAIEPGKSYSESESELSSITDALTEITTTTEFFEQEKQRERDRRDQERAQDLRERVIIGESLNDVDAKWLKRFDAKIEELAAEQARKNEAEVEAALAQARAAQQSQADVEEVIGDSVVTPHTPFAESQTDEAVEKIEAEAEIIDGTEEDLDAEIETLPISESDEDMMGDEMAATDLEIEAAEAADGEVAAAEVLETLTETETEADIDNESEQTDEEKSAARVSAATKAAEEGLAAFMDDDEPGTNH